jgi:hypothetical protein
VPLPLLLVMPVLVPLVLPEAVPDPVVLMSRT